MKHLHFNAVGGASGDMILACLFDLGLDPDVLRGSLSAWVPEPFRIEVEPCATHGLHGTRVTVRLEGGAEPGREAGGRAHGTHRAFRDIRRMIEGSDLPGPVREESVAVFRRLAEAEGRVHGKPTDEVAFHEVGAVDSIVDIVGACLGLHALGVDAVTVDPLPFGSGTVSCAHGIYPVPVPAVVELLRGFPVVATGEPAELVTPTGAALLMTWRERAPAPAAGRVTGVGYGFGHRALAGRPNLLRATRMEGLAEGGEEDDCLVLECNLDDLTPELVGLLSERILAAGALDVFSTPVFMKKQRPGVLLTVLCRPGDRGRMLDELFEHGTSFGVRERLCRRAVLARRVETVVTPYGPVRVKVGSRGGRELTRTPELADCEARAAERGVPVRRVYAAAAAAENA